MVTAYLYISNDDPRRVDDIRREMIDSAAINGDTIDSWTVERGNGIFRSKGVTDTIFMGMQPGDSLYIQNITSLGGSLSEILSILGKATERDIAIHDISGGYTAFQIADKNTYVKTLRQIDDLYTCFVSARTRAALDRKRSGGAKLGRPVGSYKKMNTLIQNSETIQQALNAGATIGDICSEYGVSYSTFKRYIDQQE